MAASCSLAVRMLLCVMALMTASAAAFKVQGKADYCCSPDQYVVSVGQVNGLQLPPSSPGALQYSDILLAIDFKKGMLGEELIHTVDGQSVKIKAIVNYKENVSYIIIGDKCTKGTAVAAYDQCIPKYAHFEGSFAVGGDELIVDSFSFPLNIPGYSIGNETLNVAQGSCIPVSSTFIGVSVESGTSVGILSSTSYVNFKKGISDPGRFFDIPAICKKTLGPLDESVSVLEGSMGGAIKKLSAINSRLPFFMN